MEIANRQSGLNDQGRVVTVQCVTPVNREKSCSVSKTASMTKSENAAAENHVETQNTPTVKPRSTKQDLPVIINGVGSENRPCEQKMKKHKEESACDAVARILQLKEINGSSDESKCGKTKHRQSKPKSLDRAKSSRQRPNLLSVAADAKLFSMVGH